MAKTLVTGGTGFIGSHVARRLVERGEDVRMAAHRGSANGGVELDCERVELDVLDRRSVRRVLRGVGRVFHCAGVTSVRPGDAERVFEVNAKGAKTVLEECLRADVERVVFNSSAAALGPARRGETADESQLFTAGHLGIPYVNAVHEAEVEALRLAARGLPLVCVNPCIAFGAGDRTLSSTRLVRSFLLGRVPVYTDGAVNIVDVDDVAEGLLLAAGRGAVGERYILGGRNFTFDRLFADLGRLSGVEPPVKVPVPLAMTGATAMRGRFPLSLAEVRAASHWWTYRSTKARRELGWKARPHEETLEATVEWHLEREHERIARTRRSQQLQYRLARAAVGTLEGAVGLVRRGAATLPG